jgi:DUF4097 and DUF4098 domain-containing protein YvlB
MAVWLALILTASFLAFQEPKAAETQKESSETPFVERTQRQFTFYPGGKIDIFALAPGNWKIVGWQKASVTAEFEKIVYHLEPAQAKVLSDQFPINVRWGQTSSIIRTTAPPKSLASIEVNATLYVPKEKTDFKIQMINGDLTIGGINGWIEANITEGSVEAKSMSGYFSVITRKGDLNVEMSGKRWLGHGFTAITEIGSASLRLPVDFSAALQFETRNGQISISFPEQLVEGESIPLKVMTKKNARSMTATVGQGGSPVKLLTMMGDITLSTAEIP